MSFNLSFGAFSIIGIGLYLSYRHSKKLNKRCEYISNYTFPSRVQEAVIKKYPHLSKEEADSVIEGLRDYFYICAKANGYMVSMPSQAVDIAWHEFLLFTQLYQNFCTKAFGKFFHHHPAEAMKSKTVAQKGIKLAWKLACKKEDISTKRPLKLPKLFSIDTLLNIEDGFKYTLNCNPIKKTASLEKNNPYCVSHIGCSGASCGGGCGGESSSDSSSSCGGGCGGGGD